jgi:hypothetical protein
LRPWFEAHMGVEIQHKTPSVRFEDLKIPDPIYNDIFVEFLQVEKISFSNGPKYRVNRSHGRKLFKILFEKSEVY